VDADLTFEWDERKNRANLRKHKIAFADAKRIFAGPITIDADTRLDYDEERWIATGLVYERAVAVVFTMPSANRIRLISARKVSPLERKKYEEKIFEARAEDELEGI